MCFRSARTAARSASLAFRSTPAKVSALSARFRLAMSYSPLARKVSVIAAETAFERVLRPPGGTARESTLAAPLRFLLPVDCHLLSSLPICTRWVLCQFDRRAKMPQGRDPVTPRGIIRGCLNQICERGTHLWRLISMRLNQRGQRGNIDRLSVHEGTSHLTERVCEPYIFVGPFLGHHPPHRLSQHAAGTRQSVPAGDPHSIRRDDPQNTLSLVSYKMSVEGVAVSHTR